jgi:hypothetical protein
VTNDTEITITMTIPLIPTIVVFGDTCDAEKYFIDDDDNDIDAAAVCCCY